MKKERIIIMNLSSLVIICLQKNKEYFYSSITYLVSFTVDCQQYLNVSVYSLSPGHNLYKCINAYPSWHYYYHL